MPVSEVPADQLINVLKDLVSVERDAELAEVFGLGKSTVASWRRRGVVPQPILDRAKSEFGLTSEFIAQKLRSEASINDIMHGNAFFHAVLRLGATLAPSEISDVASLLYRHEHAVRAVLNKEAAPRSSSGGADALSMYSAVMDGRLLGAEDMRTLLLEADAHAKAVPQ